MADSNLYSVLSGLHATDTKLKAKLVQLSGQVSDAFGADAFVTIGKADGITASTLKLGATNKTEFGANNELAVEAAVTGYVADEIQKIQDAQGNALTGVLSGNGISVTEGTKNVTISAVGDGKTIGVDASGIKSLIALSGIGGDASNAQRYALVDADGTQLGTTVIDIPKDQFLSGASYNPTTETIDLVFAINGEPNLTSIPVSGLVHEYESGDGVDVAYDGSTAAGKTKINVVVKSGDKYLDVDGSDGLFTKGIDDAITAATSGAINDIADIKTTLTGYSKTKPVSGDIDTLSTNLGTVSGDLDTLEARVTGAISASDTNIPTNAAVSAFVDSKIQEADANAVQTAETTLNESFIYGTGSGKNIKNSGLTKVETFGATPANTNIPTEKAVADYVGDAISGFVSGSDLTADKIVLGNGDQTVKTSSVGITTSNMTTAGASDDEVPTTLAVKTYVNDGLADLLTQINTLNGQIDAL